MNEDPSSLHIVVIAGEHSGDVLGAQLISALKRKISRPVSFSGVGGELMEAEGCVSEFPLSDVAVMGPLAILKQLPRLVRRVYQAVDGALREAPDIVVIIDSPEFTHPIAKRIRKRAPHIPIINYVSPSVWAWRSGRARKMAKYIDHVLALLPFEPAAHERLGGPPCTYIGHSLSEKIEGIQVISRSDAQAQLGLNADHRTLTILPGSRRSEVGKLLDIFGAAFEHLEKRAGPLNIVMPTVASVRSLVEAGTKQWSQKIVLVEGEDNKFAAFRASDVALAASGTVTLELAAAGTPMVVGYRVDPLAARLRWLVKVPSFVLPNLIIGRNAVPEFMQDDCTPENLSNALYELLSDENVRNTQLEGLADARAGLAHEHGTPSEHAAEIVVGFLE